MAVIHKQKVYKTIGSRELALHIFEAENLEKATPVPAIVFFNGGGFRVGTPAQFYPQCEYLASRGMLAMAAEYRVKEIHRVDSPLKSLADGKSAIRWIRAHAAELGVDPDRIAAGGGSAGAFITAVAGLIKAFDEENEELTVSSKPDAMVLFNIGFDAANNKHLAAIFKDHAREVSPIFQVRGGLSPAIILHGTADKFFPISEAEEFCQKMKQAGNVCELVPFEGMEHGFFNYGRHGNKPFKETLCTVDKFLSSLGFLQGEPTVGDVYS